MPSATPAATMNRFFPPRRNIRLRAAPLSQSPGIRADKRLRDDDSPISPFAIRGRKRCFCSSVPYSIICLRPPNMLPTTVRRAGHAVEGFTCDTGARCPRPNPPYSLGTPTPEYPLSDIFRNRSGEFPCPARFSIPGHELFGKRLDFISEFLLFFGPPGEMFHV